MVRKRQGHALLVAYLTVLDASQSYQLVSIISYETAATLLGKHTGDAMEGLT